MLKLNFREMTQDKRKADFSGGFKDANVPALEPADPELDGP